MDYQTYRQKYFVQPAPAERFRFRGIYGATLFFQEFDQAVEYYSRVLGPPAYVEGENTRGWKVGGTWLTLLRGKQGAPRNIEVQFVMQTPAEANRLQGAFVAAGGSSRAAVDDLMYEPVHLCPVTDPFGTEILIVCP